ncbi:transmembrane 220 family protein [Pontibacter toksunensis]|uniref:Transmembrane 220 family protein n=1 Tax=Pontibacter toksunensis TaxID=1332631 RepID=A0ABW6BUS3_9BACT
MLLKKVLGAFFGFIFIAFAVVQYNDPDPALWIAIYVVAAALSVAAGFGKVSNVLLGVAFVVYAAGVIYWWPEQFEGVGDSMRDSTTGLLLRNVEEGRESLGLGICSVAMLSFLMANRLSSNKKIADTRL